MSIKEVKSWESSDGLRHDTYEKAVERENELEFYKLVEPIECYGEISATNLWANKEKLIQFFIDKGYVKEIKIYKLPDTVEMTEETEPYDPEIHGW